MRGLILVLSLTGCLLTTAALAQQGRHDMADCSCRAPGKRVPLGDTSCLATAEGPRLATCVMNQNVTSWVISKEGCVVSSLQSADGGRRHPHRRPERTSSTFADDDS